MQYRFKKVSVFLATLFLLTILLPFMNPQAALAAAGDDEDMVTLVNQARAKVSLAPLAYDRELSVQAANILDSYQKTGQIPGSIALLQIAKNGGYSSLGQTIVSGTDVKTMVDKQLKYYGSRSILNTKYNRIGIVIADTATGKLCVQLLATKQDTPVQQPTQPSQPTQPEQPNEQPQQPQQPQQPEQPQQPQQPQQPTSFMNDLQKQVVDLVNVERAKHGLKPVVAKQDLTNVAMLKAQDMYKNKYFSHTSPTYGSPFDMMRKYGISFTAAGENIALGQRTAAEVMQGWMNSPGHRANILNANYNEIGVGIAPSYKGYGYAWVQMFARR